MFCSKLNPKIRMIIKKPMLWNEIPQGKETIQFCRQSRGSLYELIDHCDTAVECGHMDDNRAEVLIGRIKNAIRLLNGYIRYLRGRKDES
jgi:four helix bundle protein